MQKTGFLVCLLHCLINCFRYKILILKENLEPYDFERSDNQTRK